MVVFRYIIVKTLQKDDNKDTTTTTTTTTTTNNNNNKLNIFSNEKTTVILKIRSLSQKQVY